MNTGLVARFGEPAVHRADTFMEDVTVILEDALVGMELPAGALKVAYAVLGTMQLPSEVEGLEQLDIRGETYRIFDVKVDEGGLIRMGLTR